MDLLSSDQRPSWEFSSFVWNVCNSADFVPRLCCFGFRCNWVNAQMKWTRAAFLLRVRLVPEQKLVARRSCTNEYPLGLGPELLKEAPSFPPFTLWVFYKRETMLTFLFFFVFCFVFFCFLTGRHFFIVVDLRCCVGSRCAPKWFSYFLRFFSLLDWNKILTIYILYIVVCIC